MALRSAPADWSNDDSAAVSAVFATSDISISKLRYASKAVSQGNE
jgi:hypothetical protein